MALSGFLNGETIEFEPSPPKQERLKGRERYSERSKVDIFSGEKMDEGVGITYM